MPLETLVVSDTGTKLAYIDSGAPSISPYITIFALHGMCFTSPVFQKVQSVCAAKGFRFVSINRRNFTGSSPFTPEELGVMTGGSEEQKDAWMEARGHEIATFLDVFSQNHNLPPISHDGKSGGISLLGWSAGASLAFATISSVHSLPTDVRVRLSSRVRALISQEPAPLALGLPSPEKNWAPVLEQTIPAEMRLAAFNQWVTSYFEHGDLSKRDLDTLSYVLASTIRAPSIFNMSKAEIKDMVCEGEEAATDLPLLFNFAPQLKAVYHKAVFDPATSKLFDKMKVSFIAGEYGPSFGVAGFWAVQDECETFRNPHVNFKWVQGGNHFVQWDDPEKAADVYIECSNV